MSKYLVIFLSIFLGAAHAGDRDRQPVLGRMFPILLPPIEYDHPLMGVVTLFRLDRAGVLERCMIPKAWGCAHLKDTTCEITVGHDDMLVSQYNNVQVPWQLIYRHEIGHCNGWPASHPLQPRVTREELPPIVVPTPIPTKPVQPTVMFMKKYESIILPQAGFQ
jgi:hypothetical protein